MDADYSAQIIKVIHGLGAHHWHTLAIYDRASTLVHYVLYDSDDWLSCLVIMFAQLRFLVASMKPKITASLFLPDVNAN